MHLGHKSAPGPNVRIFDIVSWFCKKRKIKNWDKSWIENMEDNEEDYVLASQDYAY